MERGDLGGERGIEGATDAFSTVFVGVVDALEELGVGELPPSLSSLLLVVLLFRLCLLLTRVNAPPLLPPSAPEFLDVSLAFCFACSN